MPGPLAHLALEIEHLDPAAGFHRDQGLSTVEETERAVAVVIGGPRLVLRAPGGVPRGGVHVDFGLGTADPDAAVDRVRSAARAVERLGEGVRLRDPDGHYLTLVR